MQNRTKVLQNITAPGHLNCAALGRKSGRIIATGGLDNKINLWAVGQQNCIMSLLHKSPVQSISFDCAENMLAAGGASGGVNVWQLDGEKEARYLNGHKTTTSVVEFHPTSQYLATGSSDTNVKLWDLRQKTCAFRYKGHTGEIKCLRFSPEGIWLVSGGTDNSVKIWDITAGKMIKEFCNHTAEITDVQFHPCVLLMATSSKDRTINLYDVENFSLVSTSSRANAAGPVQKLCFHPTGEVLYAASTDCLKIYNTEPLNFLESVLVGWQNGFMDMAFSATAASSQIIGISSTSVTLATYIVDTDKCYPFAKSAPVQKVVHKENTPSVRKIPTETPKPKVEVREKDYSKKNDISKERTSPINKVIENTNNLIIDTPPPVKPTLEYLPSDNYNEPQSKVDDLKVNEKGDQKSNEDLVTDLRYLHKNIKEALIRRKEHLEVLRPRWNVNSVGSVFDEAIASNEKAVFVDLLSVLLQKENLLDFTLAHRLMPQLSKICNEKHERYIETACHVIKLILTHFSKLIKDNTSTPLLKPNLHQEERRRKCEEMYNYFKEIQAVLIRQNPVGANSVLNEVQILLSLLLS